MNIAHSSLRALARQAAAELSTLPAPLAEERRRVDFIAGRPVTTGHGDLAHCRASAAAITADSARIRRD